VLGATNPRVSAAHTTYANHIGELVVPLKESCVRCGGAWSREPSEPRHPCPHCSETLWDVEPSLDNVGMRNEYQIVEERVRDGHIMELDLLGANFSHAPCIVLSHRLKNDYRHRKNDLKVEDGRELIIVLDRAATGPKKGLPIIAELKRRRPPAAGSLDRGFGPEPLPNCTLHQAAVRLVRESYAVNRHFELDPRSQECDGCAICDLVQDYARSRSGKATSRPGWDMGSYWAALQTEVQRRHG